MKQACSLILVMLALISQLALGAMVLPDDAAAAQRSRIDDVAVLCGGHVGGQQTPVHRHHVADYAVCPLSVALALPAVILAAPMVFPVPTSAAVSSTVDRPDIRGPPVVAHRPGAPRGPPIRA